MNNKKLYDTMHRELNASSIYNSLRLKWFCCALCDFARLFSMHSVSQTVVVRNGQKWALNKQQFN